MSFLLFPVIPLNLGSPSMYFAQFLNVDVDVLKNGSHACMGVRNTCGARVTF